MPELQNSARDKRRYILEPGGKPAALVLTGAGIAILLLTVALSLLPDRLKNGKVSEYESKAEQILSQEDEITEQTPENMGVKRAAYDNSGRLSLKLSNGAVMYLGAGDSSFCDALYLNPQVKTEDGTMHAYGIYLRCTSEGLAVPEADSGKALSGRTYILTGRTYDHLADSGNGVKWTHDTYIPGDTFSTTRFYFRVVDLTARQIIGVAGCGVSFCEGVFALCDLESRDAVETGDLTGKQRVQFVNEAVDFLTNEETGYLRSAPEWFYQEKLYERSIIETVETTYFKQVLNSSGELVQADTASTPELFAVSLPSPIGPVTVYFADEAEWRGILPRYPEGETAGDDGHSFPYIAVALDLLRPESEESLIPDIREWSGLP